jgi:ubiquinone/menaquinone biosynthesis C-methylase UbiE
MQYSEFKTLYFKDAVNRNKFSYLRDYVVKNRPERLLDVGSGRGIISLELHDIVKEIHGIEYSEKNLSEANQFRQETGKGNVHFYRADGKKLPFEDNYFDMVICSQVLEHIENPREVVKEIMRVSKNKVLVDVPTPLWETWQFSYWLLSKIKSPAKTLRRYGEVKREGDIAKRAFQPGHVNKWAPWKWKALMERSGLKITEAAACYMSPTKRFNMLRPLEKTLRKRRPFRYMGMVLFIEASKPAKHKGI